MSSCMQQTVCPYNAVECLRNNSQCVLLSQLCDGKVDCIDGSDESPEYNCQPPGSYVQMRANCKNITVSVCMQNIDAYYYSRSS